MHLYFEENEDDMIYTYTYQSPDGFDDILMNSNGECLTGLWFKGSRDSDRHMMGSTGQHLSIFQDTCRWLDCYFRGIRPDNIPEYSIEKPTPFRMEVLNIVAEIPFGVTVTYGEIAREIGKRRGVDRMSAQAVGGAVGWNPICIIIPCHRVIGSNHQLTGYGGGIANKMALLRLEGILPGDSYAVRQPDISTARRL